MRKWWSGELGSDRVEKQKGCEGMRRFTELDCHMSPYFQWL